MSGWAWVAGAAVAAAWSTARPGARRRLAGLRARVRGGGQGRSRRPGPPSAEEIAGLAEQFASLARAGLPADRCWAALADHGASPAARSLAGAAVAALARGRPAAGAVLERAGAGAAAGAAAGARPGAEAVRRLAIALDVSDRTGAGRAETLAHLADSLRSDAVAAAERGAALAGPQAMASVLAVLPLAGLALGALLGARPWAVLVATPAGRLCLLGGLVLWSAGRVWTRSLVRRASAG